MRKEFKGQATKGGIYKITNVFNGKVYIGSAKCFRKRFRGHLSRLENNKHRNKHLQASWDKHGAAAFLFEVIEVVPGDMVTRTTVEQSYLDMILKNEKWDMCFNVAKKTIQTEGPWSSTPEETRRKSSKASKGRRHSAESKKKISDSLKGKVFSAETRKKLSEACRGRVFSAETRQKMSEAHKEQKPWNKGIPHSAETKRKLSEAHKGKVFSEEHKKKLSEAGKRRTPVSEETKKKMAAAKKGHEVSAETRKKISKALKGIPLSAETRKKMSIAQKKRWRNRKPIT